MNNKIREFQSNIDALKIEGEDIEAIQDSYETDKNSLFFSSLLDEYERRIKVWEDKIANLKKLISG